MKILIATSQANGLLDRSLREWGHQPVLCGSGHDAIYRIMQADPPALVILERDMPQLSGIEICRHIRNSDIEKQPYIILITHPNYTDMLKGLDAGADDYISKPINLQEFRARLEAGIRVISQKEIRTEEVKLQGVLEMAGAICHEINQPLQVISGYAEMICDKIHSDDPLYGKLTAIRESVSHLGIINQKLMNIAEYKTKDYLGSKKIIDINQSSTEATLWSAKS